MFHEEPNDRLVAPPSGLMQRRSVGVAADGIVTVGVFASFEQQFYDLELSQIGGHSEGEMPVFACR